jgi:hypothetical protein
VKKSTLGPLITRNNLSELAFEVMRHANESPTVLPDEVLLKAATAQGEFAYDYQ